MKSLLNWLAAAASLVGLFFTVRPQTQPLSALQTFFLAIVGIVFVGAAFSDIRAEKKKSAKKYKSADKINKYMYEILKNSGACDICSRDASWIAEDSIYPLLINKANNHELTFLVHKKTHEVKVLEEAGAEVIEYGELGFDPITRFTIVNSKNHAYSFVAIGKKKPNEPHIIEELDASHPTYSMATDLIRSVKIAHDNYKKD